MSAGLDGLQESDGLPQRHGLGRPTLLPLRDVGQARDVAPRWHPELPDVFRTGKLLLFYAASCPFRYSSRPLAESCSESPMETSTIRAELDPAQLFIASRLDVVMVGLPGAVQDHLPAHVPSTQPGCPRVPRRPGEG